MKLLDLINKIEGAFPIQDACDWDFVGWQVQATTASIEINQVLIVLDITKDVIEQAITTNIKLIICHHPFIFANNINDEAISWAKKVLYQQLIIHQINVYVIHTNFDVSLNGMNWLIAKDLKFDQIKYFDQEKLAVIGQYSNLALKTIISNIKKYFGLKQIKVISKNLNSKISHVLLSSGAGGSVIETISNNHDIDLIITGEMKWHQELVASDQNINVLILGHNMEEKFVNFLSDFLLRDQLIKKNLTIKQYFFPKTTFI